jgi:hypothetical protein
LISNQWDNDAQDYANAFHSLWRQNCPFGKTADERAIYVPFSGSETAPVEHQVAHDTVVDKPHATFAGYGNDKAPGALKRLASGKNPNDFDSGSQPVSSGCCTTGNWQLRVSFTAVG